MTAATIAFLPIARTTFDIPLAEEITARVRSQLDQTDLKRVGPAGLITDMAEAQAAGQALAAAPPDLLLILQATFADSTMVLALAEAIDAPLLLWAVPEAHTGGRLRLNSLCGINLAGHGLTRAGYQYDYIYAAPDDPSALAKVQALGQAARVRRMMSQARLGRVGEHPAGFDTCRYDKGALKQHFGVEVVELELQALFEQVKTAEPAQVEAISRQMGQTLPNLADLDQTAVQGTLSTYTTLRQLANDEHLNGFSMRCWPEFFTELGCAACGALSMLSDEAIPCSCEADVNGTITQLILQSFSGGPAFGTDLVSVDHEADAAVLWHCGLAPLSMADPGAKPQGTIHSNRKLPLLMEFPLKPGRVTVARLSEAGDGYRLVVGGGEMVSAPPSFSGTSGLLRFDRPVSEVLDMIMDEGLEHHISLTYGDHRAGLLALAKMWGIPVLRIA